MTARKTAAVGGVLVAAALAGAPSRAADVPGAVIVLEVADPPLAGTVPAAAPRRFVLLEDGQVFVGGTSRIVAGRLGKDEVKAFEDRVALVRKLPGLGSSVSFGEPAASRHRLQVRKGKPLDLVATGDPANAPPGLQPLATLIKELAAYSHPSLRPYEPAHFAFSAKEETLVGGCRPWGLPFAPADAVSPREVDARAAIGWPTGGTPASVCAGDKHYVVTLRPLLPGEKP